MRNHLIRFQVFALPFFVTLLLFSGPVVAQTQAEVQAENDKIDKQYQACVAHSQIAFTSDEKAMILKNRKLFSQELAKLQSSMSPKARALYEKTLAALIGKTGNQFSSKTFVAFEGIMAETNLRRFMAITVGLQNQAFKTFIDSVARSLYDQKEIDTDQFDKDRQALIDFLIVESMNRSDQALGIKVPLSLTIMDKENVAAAISAVNVLSELALRVQLDNKNLRKDRQRYNRARFRQVALGAGGFAVIIGTTIYGAPIVAAGGVAANSLGVATLVGELTAGSAIGLSGGAATGVVQQVYQIISRAYYQSLEFSTPFSCELQRVSQQISMAEAMKDGAIFGGTLGAGGTVLAAIIPKITLWLMGGAVVVGQANEVANTTYETYQMVIYYSLAQDLAELENVPENLRSEHMNLTRAALTRARTHAKKAGQHAVDAVIIATLTKPFFIDGQFRQALKEGASLVKGIAAYSSDTLPSVTYSVGMLGNKALEQMRDPKVKTQGADLFERSQKLMAQVQGLEVQETQKLEMILQKP